MFWIQHDSSNCGRLERDVPSTLSVRVEEVPREDGWRTLS